jgi:hypothetical protein
MKIAFLIGNGFDISLKLKTRYSDFYEHYIKVNSKTKLIEAFKNSLALQMKDTDKWSDLELALGDYLEVLANLEEFDDLIGDIRFELSEYLKKVQDHFNSEMRDKLSSYKLLEHLLCPEMFLKGRSHEALRAFYGIYGQKPVSVDVITFNYTNILEQILDIAEESTEHRNLRTSIIEEGLERRLLNIYHVHGSVVQDMVLGVNHDEQIKNHEFRSIAEIRNDFIKSECNLAQEHGVEDKCMTSIKKADVICIFGSSLGKTDQLWWDLIAEQVRLRNCRLVVFYYNPTVSRLNSSHSSRYKKEIINKIFGDNQQSDLASKIFVSFNSNLFKWDVF